ncbi:MAG: hypothetical protein QOE16_601 [Microbacteriaceae bacterium]|jgi:hypothetical protein|nr:hypothetical protein [Microbacteriaceae bacterium]
MRALSYDEFVEAWATYWGRREIGAVVSKNLAAVIASRPDSLRRFYDQWREAIEAFPADAALRLMGTPELTPHIIETGGSWLAADAPRPARVGRYATGTSAGQPRSEAAGDFEPHIDPKSEGARAGRALRRGNLGTLLSVVALVMAWFAPFVGITAGVWSLVLTIPITRLLVRAKVPLAKHWGYTATQVFAVVAIAASVSVMLPGLHSPTPSPKAENAMSRPYEGSLTARIVDRILTHWPSANVQAEFAGGDPDKPSFVRVRVSTHVLLEADPAEHHWSVRPMTDASGTLVPVEPERTYTIGVTPNESPEEVADRFYEEIFFWWQKLHPDVTPTQPVAPA